MAELKHRYDGMSVEVLADDVRVKYKDYFTILHLYKVMHEWFIHTGWEPERKDYDFPERLYLQRDSQQKGREYWVWWRFEKKMNAYFRCDFDIDIHINLVKDTEVMWEGKKYKTNWGEPEIKLYAKLVYDYNKKANIGSHPLLKGFKDIFYKRIIKKQKVYYRKWLHREVFTFIDLLKHYFQFKSYIPEPELAHLFPDAKLEENV